MSIPAVAKSLQPLSGAFRPCFTTLTFTTFVTLTIGMIAAPTRRTVCGMLTAARMGGHHGRAHRFFATTAWSLDQVGLTMLGLVIGTAIRTIRYRDGSRIVVSICYMVS